LQMLRRRMEKGGGLPVSERQLWGREERVRELGCYSAGGRGDGGLLD